MTFERQQADILTKMEQELLFPELTEKTLNGVIKHVCSFKNKNGVERTSIIFRNKEEANVYMPRYISEHQANNGILKKRAKVKIAQLYLETTDWVEAYIIKHMAGIETLASTSGKLVIADNRIAAKAFIKNNVEIADTQVAGVEVVASTLCFLEAETK